MELYLKIFLILGFLVCLFDIFEYSDNLLNIFLFKKSLLKFQEAMKNYPTNEIEVNKILSKLLFRLPSYECSNLRMQRFYDQNNNCMNWLTGDWLANIEYFFQDDSRYPFEVLKTRIKFSLNECDSSLGVNAFCLKRSIYKLIPIFYFHNIINYIFLFSPLKNIESSDTPTKTINPYIRWVKFLVELVGFLANAIAISPFFNKLFSHFFS